MSITGITRAIIALVFIIIVSGCGNAAKKSSGPELNTGKEQGLKVNPPLDPADPVMGKGKLVYEQYCLVCHQLNGSGVSGLNPPLRDTEYVLGDQQRLVEIILNGSNEGLIIRGVSYNNAMPGFPNLSDEEIASVATYIRNSFGNAADPVSAILVADIRQ